MTDPRDPLGTGSDEPIERVLTEALRVEPLDAAAMQRLREAASQEWRASVDRSRLSRPLRYRVLSAAAALLCVFAGVAWFLWPASPPEPFGVVVRTEAGEGGISEGLFHHRPLRAAASLSAGDVLDSRGGALITLTAGGTLRLAPGTALELTSTTGIVLRHGRIYLDFPHPGQPGEFDVSTRLGTIEHVGTAFEVLSDEDVVRIRVREGRVRLRRESQDTLVEAGIQLTADRNGNITRGSIPSYGRDWLWVAALAPDYEIEGRPLSEFLQWAARELGREVRFADSHAREVAERTILHGSVKGREPMDALSSVLSTTSLTYEIRGNTIWIQSGPRS